MSVQSLQQIYIGNLYTMFINHHNECRMHCLSYRPYFFLLIIFIFVGCNKPKKTIETPTANTVKLVKAADFNADSAYHFVKTQVGFGPRIPNTDAHRRCGNYLVSSLNRFGAKTIEQPFIGNTFDNKRIYCRNIIGSWNPNATRRLLFAAHWDTRPFSDQDLQKPNDRFDGANDGGSGVGVLLELARIMSQKNSAPNIGVDIIFFDGEDYGENQTYQDKPNETPGQWWCLGSKYWSSNKHIPNYSAYFGVLLDMVGAPNAKFAKEGSSMQFAPSVVEQIWATAASIGFANRFIDKQVEGIIDDHVYVNQIAKINMIDIIEYDNSDGNFFNAHWHTQKDDMNNIDRQTLKAVGQTLSQTMYQQAHESQNP